jgi:uncharacterized membrane protein YcgQ (UPF0703/DUF1980 family)
MQIMRNSKTVAGICALALLLSAAGCARSGVERSGLAKTGEAYSLAETADTAKPISQVKNETPGMVEIKEKMFISQVNDVYLNAGDYMGKTIKLEGLFKQQEGYDKTYWFVIRYGPGCCGFDGNAGFEVAWANESARPYPAVDSWVEATGVLKTYAEEGYDQYLYLDLSSLNVLTERGAETVTQ